MLALVAALPAAATAAEPQKQLREVERELQKTRRERKTVEEQAESVERELRIVRSQLVRAAKSAQSFEENASLLERQLRELRAKEAEIVTTLRKRDKQMVGVLTALQRFAGRPTQALIGRPGEPVKVVRAAILLRSAVPAIETEARSLKAELASLGQVRADIRQRRDALDKNGLSLSAEQQELERLVARKAQLSTEIRAASEKITRRAETLAAKADNLRDLISSLEKVTPVALPRQKPDPGNAATPAPGAADDVFDAARPFSSVKGALPLPARGRMVERYGQKNSEGVTSRGMTLETRYGAQVIAPHDGQVLYAGRFRGYGRLLIIEHGEGYHSLVAGLGRIDAVVGQWLLAGEPVGIMPQDENSGRPRLYIEFRKDSQPINPTPWLAADLNNAGG
jgi:septal ring factor EnvC (AmiA/AmiB activator)